MGGMGSSLPACLCKAPLSRMRSLYETSDMVVSLNYCSQNGGNLYRVLYYNGNPNIGPRIIGNLDQYPQGGLSLLQLRSPLSALGWSKCPGEGL